MRIAAIQHDIAWCDRAANFAHLRPLIRGAAGSGASLILLSETFSTGFATHLTQSFQYRKVSLSDAVQFKTLPARHTEIMDGRRLTIRVR